MNSKRSLKFDGINKEFVLSKVTAVHADIPTLMTIDVLKDGTYELIYNAVKILDLALVDNITILRED